MNVLKDRCMNCIIFHSISNIKCHISLTWCPSQCAPGCRSQSCHCGRSSPSSARTPSPWSPSPGSPRPVLSKSVMRLAKACSTVLTFHVLFKSAGRSCLIILIRRKMVIRTIIIRKSLQSSFIKSPWGPWRCSGRRSSHSSWFQSYGRCNAPLRTPAFDRSKTPAPLNTRYYIKCSGLWSKWNWAFIELNWHRVRNSK